MQFRELVRDVGAVLVSGIDGTSVLIGFASQRQSRFSEVHHLLVTGMSPWLEMKMPQTGRAGHGWCALHVEMQANA